MFFSAYRKSCFSESSSMCGLTLTIFPIHPLFASVQLQTMDRNRRIAVVTGAKRGVGRGIARELARQGARVFMINEFRTFAGSAPTVFFRPHDSSIDPAMIRLIGRPSDWLAQTRTSKEKSPIFRVRSN